MTGIIDISTGKPFGAGADEPLVIPDRFGCAQHWRAAQNQGVGSLEQWGPGLLAVLSENRRFIKLAGYSTLNREKIRTDALNRAMEKAAPFCCFISSPERARAIEVAKDKDTIETIRAKLRRNAERQDEMAFARRLSTEFRMPIERAATIAAKFGPKRREMAYAAARQNLSDAEIDELLAKL